MIIDWSKSGDKFWIWYWNNKIQWTFLAPVIRDILATVIPDIFASWKLILMYGSQYEKLEKTNILFGKKNINPIIQVCLERRN